MQESYEDKKRRLRIAVNLFEIHDDAKLLKNAIRIAYSIMKEEGYVKEDISELLLDNFY